VIGQQQWGNNDGTTTVYAATTAMAEKVMATVAAMAVAMMPLPLLMVMMPMTMMKYNLVGERIGCWNVY
jgi:hypothetical protein